MSRNLYRGPAVISRQEYCTRKARLQAWALALMAGGILLAFAVGFVVPLVYSDQGALSELLVAGVMLVCSAATYAGLMLSTRRPA